VVLKRMAELDTLYLGIISPYSSGPCVLCGDVDEVVSGRWDVWG